LDTEDRKDLARSAEAVEEVLAETICRNGPASLPRCKAWLRSDNDIRRGRRLVEVTKFT